jgi:DNA-binding response OmpR family regulator
MAKVLLVDDEEYIRLLYAEELSEHGYTVSTLSSGHRLLEKIEQDKPDILILDIKLVDYDGLELLQEVRNTYVDLPVVLCTAYDTYKDDLKAMAADYYVVKSFDLSELRRAVQRSLEATASISVA